MMATEEVGAATACNWTHTKLPEDQTVVNKMKQGRR